MSDTKQYNEMCEVIKTNRKTLVELRGDTLNFNLLKGIDAAIQGLDMARLEIEGVSPEDGGKWRTTPEGLKSLEDRWEKAIETALSADRDNVKKRWNLGITWFCVYTILFLGSVGAYAYLHWRFPTTDTTIFLWTGGALGYAEVAFWAFFGVMTWLLYNLQHYNRQGKDIRLWTQWYFTKMFQGVLIAVVIVVAVKQVDFGASISGSVIPVIVGFILGYYSDKARDYLDLIRDKLLPGTKAPTVTIQPPELTSDSQAYIHGTVDGPREREGTLTVGQGAPLPITIDDHGNFGLMVDIQDKPAVIKVEAKSPAKKVGSATVAVAAPGVKK